MKINFNVFMQMQGGDKITLFNNFVYLAESMIYKYKARA